MSGARERCRRRSTRPRAGAAIVQPGRELLARRARASGSTASRTPPTTSGWSGRRCSARATRSSSSAGTSSATSICCPGADRRSGRADPLDELLAFIARRRPQLRCYILIWDYAALYTLERDPFSRWRLGWRMPRRVRFGFDDRHPVGGSHHQKIVVVDDQLAFCGGIDLTGHRWDTSAHRSRSRRGRTRPAKAVRAVSRSPGDGQRAGGGEPGRAGARSLARARRGDGCRPSRAATERSLAGRRHARSRPTSTSPSPARCPDPRREPAVRECEALFLDSIAAAKRIDLHREPVLHERHARRGAGRAAARAGRPRSRDRRRRRNATAGSSGRRWARFATASSAQLLAADTHRRLRLVYPGRVARADVPTFVHSKVMVVDDELVRIGSANFSRRSMGVDTECDLAVEARRRSRTCRQGIRRIRDRLLASISGCRRMPSRAGSSAPGRCARSSMSSERADHTLVADRRRRAETRAPPSEALRAAADPDEPIGFGSSVEQLVPPVDATNGRSPLRFWILAIVLAVARRRRSDRRRSSGGRNSQTVQDALDAAPSHAGGTSGLAPALLSWPSLALVPLELLAIAAGVLFGLSRGGLVALLGSLVAAAIGYVAGRAIGPAGLHAWMSRRSYRSARQLGARGVRRRDRAAAGVGCQRRIDPSALRRGRVPFATYHGRHRHRPGAGDRRAQRSGRAASPHAAASVDGERG